MMVGHDAFDRIAQRAIRRIPREIRRHLDNVVIAVEKRPSRELLDDMDVPPGETLFGVYEGNSLLERSATDPALQPDRIILFQEPIENDCDTIDDIEYEIETTVVHEIAHYFGIEDERLAELGYD